MKKSGSFSRLTFGVRNRSPWLSMLGHTLHDFHENDLFTSSAAMSYFGLMALFPALLLMLVAGNEITAAGQMLTQAVEVYPGSGEFLRNSSFVGRFMGILDHRTSFESDLEYDVQNILAWTSPDNRNDRNCWPVTLDIYPGYLLCGDPQGNCRQTVASPDCPLPASAFCGKRLLAGYIRRSEFPNYRGTLCGRLPFHAQNRGHAA